MSEQNAEQKFVRILGFDETKTMSSGGEDSQCPCASSCPSGGRHAPLPNNNTNGNCHSPGLSQSPPGGLTLSFHPGWSSASQTPMSSSFSSPSEIRFPELELLRARYDVKHNQLAGLFRSQGEESDQSRCAAQDATNTLHGIMFGVPCASTER